MVRLRARGREARRLVPSIKSGGVFRRRNSVEAVRAEHNFRGGGGCLKPSQTALKQ